ncbi:MAG: DeoR family transcriptional regulator, partial [Alphaproteobacteria bacterium]|nr:DeoR family transcriptional regulator [Alphaproteobacteria bacterium]
MAASPRSGRVLAASRQRWLVERLAREGAVAVGAAAAELGVSRETVRRDL